MKRAIRFTATFILFGVASTGFAAVDDEQADRFVKQFMPSCIDQATVSREAVEIPVPDNLSVQILSVDTEDAYCAGRYLEVRTPTRIYVGYPWLLMSYEGTIDQKIKRFAWERMQQPVKVEIIGEPAFDGLRPATVRQVTEYGSIPLTGYVDSGSNIFFPGQFYDATGDSCRGESRRACKRSDRRIFRRGSPRSWPPFGTRDTGSPKTRPP